MKYMVTSYEHDEGATYTDFVEAPNQDRARSIVEKVRDYADVADIVSADELEELARSLREHSNTAKTPFELAKSFDDIHILRVGTPRQLRAWVNEAAAGEERERRTTEVNEELESRRG